MIGNIPDNDINVNMPDIKVMSEDGNDVVTDRKISKPAKINVITKDEFEDRVEQVFHVLWETLAKSFGPYGAPTLICNYPYTHVTKDGFTIMKNLSMDASETMVDQSIANLASDICGRLNYTVGDGTTSAIIATNRIYEAYRARKSELTDRYIMPRDVIHIYEDLKDIIISELRKRVKPIRSMDLNQLATNIREVVYISSNGDEDITNAITNFYKELGNPSITCSLASDGVTKCTIVDGYSFELVLNDKMYINSDNNTMDLDNADIIILSIKVNKTIYDNILKPLNREAAIRHRHLIVAAPGYDERTLQQTIARDLSHEFTKNRDVNMVLTTYKAFSAHNRRLLNDFAVLMNTTVLDRVLVEDILEKKASGEDILRIFNMDDRHIEGSVAVCVAKDIAKTATYVVGHEDDLIAEQGMLPYNDPNIVPLLDDAIRVGYARKISLGLKKSLFGELFYNQNAYDAVYRDAKMVLDETEKKYQKLGTFNIEVSQAQQRLYALELKMGVIEVGATSDLAQGMIKDAVDDSIRAASSAFDHGVILGCNVTLLSVIDTIRTQYQTAYDEHINKTGYIDNDIATILTLVNILFDGFFAVYQTVLGNAFDDVSFAGKKLQRRLDDVGEFYDIFNHKFYQILNKDARVLFDDDEVEKALDELFNHGIPFTLHNVLIAYSIVTNTVFDVSTLKYSDKVINSAQTDEEVLNATIDLLSLLITGNQMVVTQKHNF